VVLGGDAIFAEKALVLRFAILIVSLVDGIYVKNA
jgi:hypothetical protein